MAPRMHSFVDVVKFPKVIVIKTRISTPKVIFIKSKDDKKSLEEIKATFKPLLN